MASHAHLGLSVHLFCRWCQFVQWSAWNMVRCVLALTLSVCLCVCL